MGQDSTCCYENTAYNLPLIPPSQNTTTRTSIGREVIANKKIKGDFIVIEHLVVLFISVTLIGLFYL